MIPNPVTESALENRWPAAHDAEVRRRAEWRRELGRRVGGNSPQEVFCAIAHGRQEAGGGEQGYTADSIQSVLFSTSSILFPSSVGTSLSVQTMVTSCVKKPGCHHGPKSAAARKFELLEAASSSAPHCLRLPCCNEIGNHTFVVSHLTQLAPPG